jgi:C_GCAxxG_C_C family probable redox protein
MSVSPGKRAQTYFAEGHNCAQAVLRAAGEALGKEQLHPVALAFGGGMGRTGRVCGALTGALMAIGAALAGTEGARDRAYRLAQELLTTFAQQYGHTDCRQLTGCLLMDPEEHQRFEAEQVRDRLCMDLVGFAADSAVELARRH